MEQTSVTPSPKALRALSHPTRLRMLGLLRREGPATATALAARVGVNTGAASYHLRQLGEHGFIEEDAERGDARDRWWKASHQSTHADLELRASDEDADSSEAYLHSVALLYTEILMQHVDERRYLPEPWREASTTSDWHLRLTPERAEQMKQALVAVIAEWGDAEDAEDTPGTGDFVINLNAYPRPGTVVLEGTD